MIKQYCGNRLEVCSCTNRKGLFELDLSAFSIAIVIVIDRDDLIDLMWIYSRIRIIYLGTNLKDAKEVLEKIDDIIIVDLEKKKLETVNFIFASLLESM